ncbi:adaptative response regulatory protein Ada [Citrobacter koseri]|uniref:Adaptative response regulatory protein Ada n=1 Tax=Citrobacter koseri TaxID=545 RepID=A0A2X2XSW9_CITKO|nr:adaptative response regulatory protein Ada [Citrobacter koseri]
MMMPGSLPACMKLFPAAQDEPADRPFQQRVRQVIASINARDIPLSLPLDIQGTAFQQQVWQALRAIPCGETVSYQQIASAIGPAEGGSCRCQRLRGK